MFKYYNAHPKGKHVNDCVKRAIAITTGMEYDAISRELNSFKKVTGAKTFNSNQNPHHYVEDVLGAEKITLASKITADQFCENYPKGRYILDMDGHWSCCVDGVIYDTWDTGEKTVNFSYKITPSCENEHLRYCCTAKAISEEETLVRIYDGNGTFSERVVPTDLARGYIRCLEDSHYTYVEF